MVPSRCPPHPARPWQASAVVNCVEDEYPSPSELYGHSASPAEAFVTARDLFPHRADAASPRPGRLPQP